MMHTDSLYTAEDTLQTDLVYGLQPPIHWLAAPVAVSIHGARRRRAEPTIALKSGDSRS
jgi:hypothetical protein